MQDLDEALANITAIRHQMARQAEFRGYGPATLAATGVLALLAAALQALWLKDPGAMPGAYLALWVLTAAVSATLVGIEAVTRSRRVHSGLADEMITAVVEQFLPSAAAGALLTVVLWRFAPASLWMLPGLWQIVFSLGVFASRRYLPRPIFAIGLWYLASGLACLAFAGGAAAFSPWAMGAPFGIGQLLVAAVLQHNLRQGGDDA
jgi:hypothetical protein